MLLVIKYIKNFCTFQYVSEGEELERAILLSNLLLVRYDKKGVSLHKSFFGNRLIIIYKPQRAQSTQRRERRFSSFLSVCSVSTLGFFCIKKGRSAS